MRVSHLILDTYDMIQTPEQQTKLAALGLDSSILPGLPDRLFALVAENEGSTLRKYAIHDEINTRASIDAFLLHGDVLPESVQKIAAENLLVAASWYDIEVPQKLAERVPDVSPGTVDIVDKAKMIGTKEHRSYAMEDIPEYNDKRNTPDIYKEVVDVVKVDNALKFSSLNGTELMPESAPNNATATGKVKYRSPNTIKHAGDLSGYEPPAAPRPVYEPVHYALPSEQKYAIDTPDQVIKAAAYFDEWMPVFSPEQRREFAYYTVKRAHQLVLPVTPKLASYAGDELGDSFIEGVRQRIERCDEDLGTKYAALRDKALAGEIHPQFVARALEGLDKTAGLDNSYGRPVVGVDDAYKTCFGMKTAEEYSWSLESASVNEGALKSLAESGSQKLAKAFGEGFANAFQEDPVDIFKSMPDPQKMVIAKLAAESL